MSHVRDLMQDRSLLFTLVAQDLKLKYRGTLLGFVWATLNPLLMLTVMAVAFTYVFNKHYPLHLFATLLPWQFFQTSQTHGCRSLTTSGNIILHWKTPLLLFPVRKTLLCFCEYLFALIGLSCIAWFLGFRPSASLAVLPLSMLILLVFTMSLSVIMSVAAVFFRDVQHVMDVVMRAWFYLSPVLIPASRYPEKYLWILKLNPMYHFLELFDAPIARATWPETESLVIAAGFAVVSTIGALLVFNQNESRVIYRI